MRKLVAGFAVSLDGYIEGPRGEFDWILVDETQDFAEEAKRFDAFLFGRKSYEKLATGGASSFPGIASYVVSTTLSHVETGFVLLRGDLKTAVADLKNQPGKDIALYGGAELLTSLLADALVDELILNVIPVLLGGGKPFVGSLPARVPLRLSATTRLANGTVRLAYQLPR